MTATKACAFWSCNERIPVNHKVCDEHYSGYAAKKLDECPSCGRLKEAHYPQCLICKNGKTSKKSKGVIGRIADAVGEYITEENESEPKQRSRKPRATTPRKKAAPKLEISKSPSTVATPIEDAYFVYILQLGGGDETAEYYVGQTNNLRARKREHKNGATKSTKGRNPKLVWFAAVRTRAEAESYEKHLQEVAGKRGARAITNMIVKFEDLVRELENPTLTEK